MLRLIESFVLVWQVVTLLSVITSGDVCCHTASF